MMSKAMTDALDGALAIEKTIKADDPRLSKSVVINFEDGSFACYDSAFVEIHEDWLYLFPEHYPVQVHHLDDVSFWGEFERQYPIDFGHKKT